MLICNPYPFILSKCKMAKISTLRGCLAHLEVGLKIRTSPNLIKRRVKEYKKLFVLFKNI